MWVFTHRDTEGRPCRTSPRIAISRRVTQKALPKEVASSEIKRSSNTMQMHVDQEDVNERRKLPLPTEVDHRGLWHRSNQMQGRSKPTMPVKVLTSRHSGTDNLKHLYSPLTIAIALYQTPNCKKANESSETQLQKPMLAGGTDATSLNTTLT